MLLVYQIEAYEVSAFDDRLFWTLAKDSDLFPRDYYLHMLGLIVPCPNWRKDIWAKYNPSACSVLCWRFLLDHLPTDDCIQQLSYSFCSLCSLYCAFLENANHILLIVLMGIQFSN